MHTPKALLLTSILTLFRLTSAAPVDEPNASPPPERCIFPAISFSTIQQEFTLSAITDQPITPWPVQLRAPSATESFQPYISRTKIAQPVFRLTNGKLSTGGPNNKKFPAYFGITAAVFPPVSKPLFFGGDAPTTTVEFFAGYTCDAERNQYLELRTVQPLVVPQLSEAQKISVKPEAFQGTSVTIHLKINTISPST